jgi:CPA2 family monovalent cation:H+ antiporter-2
MHYELLPLLLVTLLAALVPILASRLKSVSLPIVVGEILAGIIIGKSGFGWVHETQELEFLADFGFIYLMFLSGLEMNFSVLLQPSAPYGGRPLRQRPVFLATTTFLGSVLLAVAVGYLLTSLGLARSAVLMGLILSTTSLGVVVPVLKEQGYLKGVYGQCLLLAALISDFMTLLLLSAMFAWESDGLSPKLMLFLGLLAAFAAAVHVGQRMRRKPFLRRTLEELSHATAQIRVRGAFAIMVSWVFLADKLGAEVILGAFLAGAFISIISGKAEEAHRQKLEAIGYGFFIPIFFIHVGTIFDLKALTASPQALLLVPFLVLAAYLVKLAPAVLFRFAFTWRETLGGGVLLAARLSLIIAAASIALELKLITPATNAALILVAIISCTLSPVLFARMVPPPLGPKRRGVIIAGGGHLGILLGGRLNLSGESVRFITSESSQAAKIRSAGFKVVQGGVDKQALLERAGAAQAESLVLLSDDEQETIEMGRLAKEHFMMPTIVGLAQNNETAEAMEALGMRVVRSILATALALEGALHFPASFEMLTDVSYGLELSDGLMRNPSLAGSPLKNVNLPGGVLVMGIRRQGEAIIPHGDTDLRFNDVLTLVGKPENLRQARDLVEGRDRGVQSVTPAGSPKEEASTG